MATIEGELKELRQRVERLESTVWKLAKDRPASIFAAPEAIDSSTLVALLKAEGLMRAPTTEELRMATEWENLPEEEKQAVRSELDHLPPGPMASDIIIENRN